MALDQLLALCERTGILDSLCNVVTAREDQGSVLGQQHALAPRCLAAGSFAHNDSFQLMGTLALTSPENLHALLHRRCSDVAFRLI